MKAYTQHNKRINGGGLMTKARMLFGCEFIRKMVVLLLWEIMMEQLFAW